MTIEAPAALEATADQPAPGRLIGNDYVDPHTLVIEDNVRSDTGDVSDLDPAFLASIAEHGVRQPIIVRRRVSDGRYVVRLGKGRTRAARHADRWVDVAIERDPATETDDDRDEQIARIIAQLDENQRRAALPVADEVRAHGQLMLLWEMSPDEIAVATHTDPERVRRTTTVAASHTAMDMLTQLNLEHLEVIAELDGDDTAVAELVQVALNQPSQFPHVAQRLRQARELADARAVKVRELVDAGTPVVDPSEHEDAMELHKLRARPEDPQYSASIPEEDHAGCPGHAVSVDAYRRGFGSTIDLDVLTWCLAPDTHGHVPIWAASTAETPQQSTGDGDGADGDGADSAGATAGRVQSPDGPSPEDPSAGHGFSSASPVDPDHAAGGSRHDDPEAVQRAAERAAEAERARRYEAALQRFRVDLTRNRTEAAQAAATVRREWLAGFLRRKTPPKEAARYIIEALVLWQVDFDDAAAEGHDLACELLGMQPPELDDPGDGRISRDLLTAARSATAGRATVLTLALVLAGQERELTQESWRHHTRVAGPYLRVLAGWSYPLSPIEKLMIDPDDLEVTIDGDPTPPPDPDHEASAEGPGDEQSASSDNESDDEPDDGPDFV